MRKIITILDNDINLKNKYINYKTIRKDYVDPNVFIYTEKEIKEEKAIKEIFKLKEIKEIFKLKENDKCCSNELQKIIKINEIKVLEKEKEIEKRRKETELVKELKNIECTVNNLDDLIKLIDENPYDEKYRYNINLKGLHNIYTSLIELRNMIGMQQIKENIVDQILYFIQDLHLDKNDEKGGEFMHTVIYGPPGTGKTEVSKIMGQIFCKLGILKNGTFKKVTRSDLIAGYLGQTAIKTNDVIKECLGGVLFIDEAYSLGNTEKKDSFSKECIDTICEGLSNHKNNLMVIIAGYEKELNECFFNYNQGLNSRFIWRFKIDNYKSEELYRIFIKKIKESKWDVDEINIKKEWFEKNMCYFKFYGRDIEVLLSKTKIAHSRRIFCNLAEKKKITKEDLNKGFEMYISNEEVKNRKDGDSESMKKIIETMYC